MQMVRLKYCFAASGGVKEAPVQRHVLTHRHTRRGWGSLPSFFFFLRRDIRNMPQWWSDESHCLAKSNKLGKTFSCFRFPWFYPTKMLYLEIDTCKEFHNLIWKRLFNLILHRFSWYNKNVSKSPTLSCFPLETLTNVSQVWLCWCKNLPAFITMTIRRRYCTHNVLLHIFYDVGENAKWAGGNRYCRFWQSSFNLPSEVQAGAEQQ